MTIKAKNKYMLKKLDKKMQSNVILAAAFVFAIIAILSIIIIKNDASDLKGSDLSADTKSSKNPNSETSNQSSTVQKEDDEEKTSTPQPSLQKTKQDSDSTESAANGLLAPTGNFVSTHSIKALDQNIESTCTTSPGANCEIVFVRGEFSKSLVKKIVGQSGTVYWNWAPVSLGLESGSWQIKAISSFNDASRTVIDPMQMDINL